MKFSIICPVFNSELFLNSCINSIIDQTYTEWELILIDDGSTDSSSEICEQACQKDERIRYWKQENSGPFFARFVGIQMARGDYLLFIDSDDMLVKTCLKELDDVIVSSNKIDCIIFQHNLQNKTLFDYSGFIFPSDAKENILTTDILNSVCLKCISKSAIDKCDFLSFQTRCIFAEDKIMSLEMIDKCQNIFLLNKRLYIYRNNEHSTTRSGVDLYKLDKKYNKGLLQVLLNYDSSWFNGKFRNAIFSREINELIHLTRLIFSAYSFSYIKRNIDLSIYDNYKNIRSISHRYRNLLLDSMLKHQKIALIYFSFYRIYKWFKK